MPAFGNQDLGVSPSGAMDLFSYATGNILLGNDANDPALEIIVPPVIRFTEDAWFVVTGAGWSRLTVEGSNNADLHHAEVYRASAGDTLIFGEKRYGFRSYLCYKAVGETKGNGPEGRRRGDFRSVASWPDEEGRIRVVEGPEYPWLKNSDDFFTKSFRIGKDSNAMGLRLEAAETPLVLSMEREMISQAVSDGTVQLTQSGPVILLRDRQTLGGYPRIFNVISADLDILAQVGPFERIRFRKVTFDQALDALRRRQDDLDRIKKMCVDHGG
jgi:allophanate hydrolase subunit 2